MGEITFLLGGARSGKSSYAVELAKSLDLPTAYIATATPSDEEMKVRIERHKRSRPSHWKTIEEPLNVDKALKKLDGSTELILLDCLSLLVSNLLLHYQNQGLKDAEIEKKVVKRLSEIISTAKVISAKVIIVSNEVGMGLVPETPLGRIFRDVLGETNQMVAARADQTFFLVAGLPIRLK